MAHKSYIIKKDGKIVENTKEFFEKMFEEYQIIGRNELKEGGELIEYDINNVGILFYFNGADNNKVIRETFGDVEMLGRLEDIILTEKEIEGKTSFNLGELN